MLTCHLGLSPSGVLTKLSLIHPTLVVGAANLAVVCSNSSQSIEGAGSPQSSIRGLDKGGVGSVVSVVCAASEGSEVLVQGPVLHREIRVHKLLLCDFSSSDKVSPDFAELSVHGLLDVSGLAQEVAVVVVREGYNAEAAASLELQSPLLKDLLPVIERSLLVRFVLNGILGEHRLMEHGLHRHRNPPEPVHGGGGEHEVNRLAREAVVVE
mmetsp:Transcript_38550/g.60116  ORF Transcript_38550/g.60116 Transcript_38550/m.60116 type:complete len:211 (+) Transcript_38550:470-1102(+)